MPVAEREEPDALLHTRYSSPAASAHSHLLAAAAWDTASAGCRAAALGRSLGAVRTTKPEWTMLISELSFPHLQAAARRAARAGARAAPRGAGAPRRVRAPGAGAEVPPRLTSSERMPRARVAPADPAAASARATAPARGAAAPARAAALEPCQPRRDPPGVRALSRSRARGGQPRPPQVRFAMTSCEFRLTGFAGAAHMGCSARSRVLPGGYPMARVTMGRRSPICQFRLIDEAELARAHSVDGRTSLRQRM